ncbi:MAG: HU family DNA-binding protein [bacterium]
MKLTRKDLVVKIAEDIDVPQKTIKDIIENLFVKISDNLSKGGDVEFRGFGVFKTKERKKRLGRNPKTGKAVSIPERRVVVFKPGNILKKKIESRRPL